MPPKIDSAWFKDRMREIRLRQDALGRALGCDRSVVSRIINGRQELALSQVLPMAEALQVSPFEILKRAGFWEGHEGIEPQWATLHDEVSPEDRERIVDAMRAFSRRRK
jgi:transcriptional regulator with XRE-family HTH domain